MNNDAIVTIILFLFAGVIVYFARKRDARLIFRSKYAADQAPSGPARVCEIGFPASEVSTPCIAHSSAAGLYIYSSEDQMRKVYGVDLEPSFLKTPVCIPWSDMRYRRAPPPLVDMMRIDLTADKATFFIKRDIAEQLLRDAGKSIQ